MSVLYLNGWQVSASLRDRRIVAENVETREITQVALFSLQRVVCIGCPHLSMPLLHQLLRNDIPVVFLSGKGRWLGTLMPQSNGNASRRVRQYQSSSVPTIVLKIARALVDVKIHNMRRMLQRWSANRKQAENAAQKNANRFLQECRRKLARATTLDEIRGFEGTATACYFKRMNAFLPAGMPFVARSRQPPKNPVNALLSWTYAIVTAEIETALRLHDLDPCIGYLHDLYLGRPSLALDLMEPLRAPLCDALALRIINRKLLTPQHFEFNRETGGYYLKDEFKKIFFKEYENNMERVFIENVTGVPTTFRKVILRQVISLCQAFEENKEFQPFLNS